MGILEQIKYQTELVKKGKEVQKHFKATHTHLDHLEMTFKLDNKLEFITNNSIKDKVIE